MKNERLETITSLKKAKSRIALKHRWTQRAAARDLNGERCDENSSQATQWCAVGAVAAAFAESYSPELEVLLGIPGYGDALAALASAVDHSNRSKRAWQIVTQYNDSHEHSEVLHMFDKAINILEMKQDD